MLRPTVLPVLARYYVAVYTISLDTVYVSAADAYGLARSATGRSAPERS